MRSLADVPDKRPPAVQLFLNLGFDPDPWQIEVLEGGYERLLLNCCRQGGKSTVVAMLALSEAMFVPGTQVLILSRSHRQSKELLRVIARLHSRLGSAILK